MNTLYKHGTGIIRIRDKVLACSSSTEDVYYLQEFYLVNDENEIEKYWDDKILNSLRNHGYSEDQGIAMSVIGMYKIMIL